MTPMLSVPYFDNVEIESDADLSTDVMDAAEKVAWVAFLAKGPVDRVKDSRHLFAYYEDYRKAVGGGAYLDAVMAVPQAAADIWLHVRPKAIWATKSRRGDDWYIEVEADCDWDEEHGVHMVWENGNVLNKVGGYAGHPTNYFNPRTPETDRVVYSPSFPEFTTYRD